MAQMGSAYPELKSQQATIERVLKAEEEQFARTLERGMQILSDALENLEGKVIPGELVFKLYDTYGFPSDLTNDVAREKGYSIDEQGFEAAMAEQRKRAQAASNFGADYNAQLTSENSSEFTGYEQEEGMAEVVELFNLQNAVSSLAAGEQGIVVLDNTPFYAESGGQVGDTGVLKLLNGAFRVTDTVKLGNAIAHKGVAEAAISVGDKVDAQIDTARRQAIKLNHSATHLLHAALKNVLGEHVNQKGSLVQPDKLRFDFSHFEGVTREQLVEIENMVNQQVRENHDLTTRLMAIDDAKAAGAQALFGEKYDDEVRVVSMGAFSMELCGGTHVKRTGDIGLLRIVSESGIASGVRRIEAVTGAAALAYSQQQSQQLQGMASQLKSDVQSVPERVGQLLEQAKGLEKEIQQLKQKLASQAGADMLSNIVEINGVKLLAAKLEGVEAKSLRDLMDSLKNKLGSGVLMLGVAEGQKVSLIAGVTKDLTDKVKAGELVNFVAQQVGGKGGGRPDMAQAGGTQPENLDAALAGVSTWLADKL